MLELLRELNADDGRTIVMVLHDLNQAARYAQRMLAIRDGRLIAEGRPEEVVTEAVVRDVFGLDVRIIDDPVAGTPLCVPLGSPRAAPARPGSAA